MFHNSFMGLSTNVILNELKSNLILENFTKLCAYVSSCILYP